MSEVSFSQRMSQAILKPKQEKLPRAARSWVDFFRHFAFIGSLLLLVVCGMLFNLMFYTIHFGEVGVIFRRFAGGTVTDYILGEGFKVIPPWDILYIYDHKIQERQFDVDVLMTNGLTMYVGVSVRFNPIERDIGRLHKLIGPAYEKKIILPVVSAAVREVLGKYLPEELYSQKRESLQMMVEERSRIGVADKFINIDRLIIRGITMPKLINDSIEAKLEQQQKYQEYVFRIQKEKQEAERKRIEAEGIHTYNSILAKSLNHDVLEYAEIQMKNLLAISGNSRTVIMDLNTENGKSNASPPVILNLSDEANSLNSSKGEDDKKIRQEIPKSELTDKLKEKGLVSQSSITIEKEKEK